MPFGFGGPEDSQGRLTSNTNVRVLNFVKKFGGHLVSHLNFRNEEMETLRGKKFC